MTPAPQPQEHCDHEATICRFYLYREDEPEYPCQKERCASDTRSRPAATHLKYPDTIKEYDPQQYKAYMVSAGDKESYDTAIRNATLQTSELFKAARFWWLMKRPYNWNEKRHINHPTVNCVGEDERALGKAVAEVESLRTKEQP